jgi:hypothetical protein
MSAFRPLATRRRDPRLLPPCSRPAIVCDAARPPEHVAGYMPGEPGVREVGRHARPTVHEAGPSQGGCLGGRDPGHPRGMAGRGPPGCRVLAERQAPQVHPTAARRGRKRDPARPAGHADPAVVAAGRHALHHRHQAVRRSAAPRSAQPHAPVGLRPGQCHVLPPSRRHHRRETRRAGPDHVPQSPAGAAHPAGRPVHHGHREPGQQVRRPPPRRVHPVGHRWWPTRLVGPGRPPRSELPEQRGPAAWPDGPNRAPGSSGITTIRSVPPG